MSEEIILLPCPFCGSTDLDPSMALSSTGEVNSGCYRCGAIGPQKGNEIDAAKAWNTRADAEGKE